MSTPVIPAWPRPNLEARASGRARQHYIAFFADDSAEIAVSAEQDGLPEGDPLRPFKVEAYHDRDWLAGWSAGALATLLESAEGIDPAAVRRCTAAMAAWANVPDPGDLAVLQGGMALCRGFARAGAIAVFDVVTLRWWSPEALLGLAPDRPFDIGEHVGFTFERKPVHPEVGNFCHSRGMAKFARPDVALHVAGVERAPEAGLVLSRIATAMALGLLPEPGQTARVAGVMLRFEARGDDSAAQDPLFFNHWFELVDAETGGQPFG